MPRTGWILFPAPRYIQTDDTFFVKYIDMMKQKSGLLIIALYVARVLYLPQVPRVGSLTLGHGRVLRHFNLVLIIEIFY